MPTELLESPQETIIPPADTAKNNKVLDTAQSGLTARERQLMGLKPYKKGQSGNPLGRPKRRDITQAFERKLRKGAAEKIAQATIATACDGENARQIAALQVILDRVEGPIEQSATAAASVTINMPASPRPAWTRALEAVDAQVIEDKVDAE